MSFRRFSRRLAQSWAPGGPALVMARSVDSTNSLARRVAAGYRAEGRRPVAAAVVAGHQSAGRGRGGHVWVSPAGRGVYASLLLPAIPAERLADLPLRAGLGLAAALRPLVSRPVALRWPNDLLVGRRKIGGILIESMAAPGREPTVVVGFGVNHGRVDVSGATSICAEAPSQAAAAARAPGPEGLADLAARLVAAVADEIERPADVAETARRYAAASVHRRGDRLRCRTPAGVVEGRFWGFDERGFLRLETAEGERSMASGDLIWSGEAR